MKSLKNVRVAILKIVKFAILLLHAELVRIAFSYQHLKKIVTQIVHLIKVIAYINKKIM